MDDGGGANGLSSDAAKALADRRPVYALLTAEGISQVGNMMTIVAGPWFVLQTTGSAAKTGLVGAALALGLLAPVLGGPLVDRVGFRRGTVVADVLSAATVASIPALHLAGSLAGAVLIYGTLALSPPLVVAIVAAVAAGLAFGSVNPIFATVTQEHTPPHLLGRVFGTLTAIAQAAFPIGAAIAGWAVQRAGLIPTIVGMGLVYVVVTIAMFFNPALRGMDVRGETGDVRAGT